jgi:hypothetical protein
MFCLCSESTSFRPTQGCKLTHLKVMSEKFWPLFNVISLLRNMSTHASKMPAWLQWRLLIWTEQKSPPSHCMSVWEPHLWQDHKNCMCDNSNTGLWVFAVTQLIPWHRSEGSARRPDRMAFQEQNVTTPAVFCWTRNELRNSLVQLHYFTAMEMNIVQLWSGEIEMQC